MSNLCPGGNKGQTFPGEPLTSDEVKALMKAFQDGPMGDRNRALVAVMYRAGLRVSEALALRPQDVNAREGTVRVLRGKGRKARTVGIDDAGLRFVERWLTTRDEHGLDWPLLFMGRDGEPLEPASVRQILYRAARRAGIGKRVHPHGLRHSLAVELAREGVPVPIIQRQLGHANVAVTSIYIDHLSPGDVIAAMRERSVSERDVVAERVAAEAALEVEALLRQVQRLQARLERVGR